MTFSDGTTDAVTACFEMGTNVKPMAKHTLIIFLKNIYKLSLKNTYNLFFLLMFIEKKMHLKFFSFITF